MKNKLQCFFIGLALLAGVHPALAQPALGIVPTNNQSLLYWPATATDYVLQSSTNLASTNWVFATDAIPATYGSQPAVTVTNTSAARFFRLISVPPTADGMVLIPAGEFTIGDTLDGESDAIPTNVYVSAFYMDVNLVSSNQWAGVYSYATNHGYSFVHPGLAKAANNPVQTVDWYDSVKWCNARSQEAGLTPVYYTDVGFTQVYTNGEVEAVYVNWTNSGYRLPTEAEWEKAARGGLSGQRFPWGSTISESQANYIGNTATNYDLGPNGFNTIGSIGGTSPATSPVGSFTPNGYGLYDMAGNLNEWCWDWKRTLYTGGIDPRGPVSGTARILRGGVWDFNAYGCRCANRVSNLPSVAFTTVTGFRCARGLNNPPAGMALIPAGSFTIGNSIGDSDITDANPTNVTVSAFYMDVNLVSLSQWQGVYSYATNHGYTFTNAGASKAANHPVQTVDWYDCVKWCNARSQQAGLTPVYYTDTVLTQVYTNGEVDITNANVNWAANGYRLPTEAEWEKAARGGLSAQRFPRGNTISQSHANYYGDTNDYSYDLGPNGYNPAFTSGGFPYTSPVGYFAPNGYGLYDMAGNLAQWCWDWYAIPPYPAGSPYLGGTNPTGAATGSYRVLRGGQSGSFANHVRCAFRGGVHPLIEQNYYGFRCVRGH